MAAIKATLNPEGPPDRPELHASKQKLRDVLKPSYWQQLCPSLHVTDKTFMEGVASFELPEARLDDVKEQISYAGVAQVASPELPWSLSPDILAQAIVTLMRYGWPPSLLVVYDEVWSLIKQAGVMMDKATGGNACNMDILAWLVDPNQGHVGFSPHRDRQPDDSPATFRSDGTPMYATLWLALTDATPENSCLYVIPRFADPGYYAGDPDDAAAPDPLTTALHNKESFQNIRALPAPKGSAAIFTHRTIHWGSKGRPGYPTPRISMSWGCADDAYEPAYFSREYLPCPPLELRLALAGAQMIIYHERFPAPPKQLALYYQAFTAQADKFDPGYRSKVMREFVDASKEATAGATVQHPGTANGGRTAVPTRRPAAAAAAAAAGAGDESNKRKAAERNVPSSTEAAAVNRTTDDAAAAAAVNGTRAVSGTRKRTASVVPAATAAAADNDSSKSKKKQKRGVSGPETAAAAAVSTAAADPPAAAGVERGSKRRSTKQVKTAAAAAEPSAAEVEQSSKRRSTRQATTAAAAAAELAKPSAAAAAEESEEADDGIDWAAVTAAARKRAKKEQQRNKKHRGRGKGTATGSSSSSSSSSEDDIDDDSDGNVMDLALDSMLDAALAGEHGFRDDYDDE